MAPKAMEVELPLEVLETSSAGSSMWSDDFPMPPTDARAAPWVHASGSEWSIGQSPSAQEPDVEPSPTAQDEPESISSNEPFWQRETATPQVQNDLARRMEDYREYLDSRGLDGESSPAAHVEPDSTREQDYLSISSNEEDGIATHGQQMETATPHVHDALARRMEAYREELANRDLEAGRPPQPEGRAPPLPPDIDDDAYGADSEDSYDPIMVWIDSQVVFGPREVPGEWDILWSAASALHEILYPVITGWDHWSWDLFHNDWMQLTALLEYLAAAVSDGRAILPPGSPHAHQVCHVYAWGRLLHANDQLPAAQQRYRCIITDTMEVRVVGVQLHHRNPAWAERLAAGRR